MINLSSLRSRFRLTLIFLLFLFPHTGHALTAEDVEAQLENLIHSDSIVTNDQDAKKTSTEELREDLFEILVHDPEILNSDEVLTEERIIDAIHDAFFRVTMSNEERAYYIQKHLGDFLKFESEESAYALMHLLVPYAQKKGFCKEGITKESGECIFGITTDGVNAAGTYPQGNEEVPIPVINIIDVFKDLGSELGTSALPLGQRCDDDNFNTNSTEDWDSGSGKTKINDSGICYHLEYAYFYYTAYDCQYDGCRASAEGFGGVLGKYLEGGADTIGAVIPLTLRCNLACVLGALKAAGNGGDYAGYMLKRADFRNRQVHSSGSKAGYVVLKNCMTDMPSYTTRLPYRYLANNSYDLSFDKYDKQISLKLGTHHQKPRPDFYFGTSMVGPQSTNMYPLPTYAYTWMVTLGLVPRLLPNWTYEFNEVRGQQNNLMFGATDNYETGNSCTTNLPLNYFVENTNISAWGNQFWYWHGVQGTDKNYELDTVKYLIGFQGGHLPLLCN